MELRSFQITLDILRHERDHELNVFQKLKLNFFGFCALQKLYLFCSLFVALEITKLRVSRHENSCVQ